MKNSMRQAFLWILVLVLALATFAAPRVWQTARLFAGLRALDGGDQNWLDRMTSANDNQKVSVGEGMPSVLVLAL